MRSAFDETLFPISTYDPTAGSLGWFDDELSAEAAGAAAAALPYQPWYQRAPVLAMSLLLSILGAMGRHP